MIKNLFKINLHFKYRVLETTFSAENSRRPLRSRNIENKEEEYKEAVICVCKNCQEQNPCLLTSNQTRDYIYEIE